MSFVSFERISTEEVRRGFDDATIFVDGAKFFWRKREFAAEYFLRRDRCLGKIDAESNCSLPRAARVLAKLVSCLFAFSFSFSVALRTRGFYRKFRTLVDSEMDRAKRDEAHGLQRRTKESFKLILAYTGWKRKDRDKTYR